MYSLFSLAGNYPLFSNFTTSLQPTILFFIMATITAFIVMRGVKKGIESVSKKLMPILFVFFGVLLINSITSPGFAQGISFYLTPDFSQLRNIDIWILGFGQALFSLSVGQGILLTYGSYMKRSQALPRATGWIVFADTLIAVLAGLIIFPIVFSFGLDPAGGPSLAFVTLPQIFNSMGVGFTIGAIFFFVLFIGALTSAISMFEVPVAAFIEQFKMKRSKAVLLAVIVLIMTGLPSALSYSGYNINLAGLPFMDAMDYFAGTLLTIISTMIIALYVNKHQLLDKLMEEINYKSKFKFPHLFADIFHFLVPGIIFMLLIFGLI